MAPPSCDSSEAEPLARIQQTGVRFSVAAPRWLNPNGAGPDCGSGVSGFDSRQSPQNCQARFRPCGAADQRGSLRRSRSSVQIWPGPPAGVAQWQSASPVRTKPKFDSRRRLQAGGIRAAEYPTLTRRSASSSLAARTRVCPVSSDGRAPVLQTGSRRLEPSTGYQIWGRRLIGRTPVLQTGNEGSSPSSSTKFGGHGSVAESDIASVGTRVRFPLTAPRGVGI